MQQSISTINSAMVENGPLPCFASLCENLIAAEQSSGWLDECDDTRRFLAISQELVGSLAIVLRKLAGSSTVLEVCAGSGELSSRLVGRGVRIQATDVKPPESSKALCISAEAALLSFQPSVVLGVFVPYDSGVDEAVLACPSVRHYIILNARLNGEIGSSSLWRTPGWKSEPLEDVSRWMITRHDVWLGHTRKENGDVLQHGEVWHFNRDALKPRDEGRSYL